MKKVIYAAVVALACVGIVSAACIWNEDKVNYWAIVASVACLVLSYALADDSLWNDRK